MSIPSTDIDALHVAIQSALAVQFPTARVEFYDRPGDRIATPAILLELEDVAAQEPDDIGTEQVPVMLNFNAYCVLDYKAGKKQAVKTLAAAVMAFVRGKKWGEPVSRAYILGAYPDVITGREDDYEVMRVEFMHEALLGTDVWTADQLLDDEDEPLPPPSELFVGESPNIGEEHEDDYTQIKPCGMTP